MSIFIHLCVAGYVKYICEQYPHIIEESVDNVPSLERQLIERLKVSTTPIELDYSTTAELLIGKCSLSQRGYKSLRKILKQNNVELPLYDKVRRFCTETDVGKIEMIHNSDNNTCKCMGVQTDLKDTLQHVLSCEQLYSEFHFFNTEEQEKIFSFLKGQDLELYRNLDPKRRTIFIKDTGDNFRAASRYPTEQTSFSILNIKKLVNCPYGQFLTTLWRGSESREMLCTHIRHHYEELTELVKYGVTLFVNGTLELFNVVAYFVADLCFVKDVIGLCACTSTYGCYHCLLKREDWLSKNKKIGSERSLSEISKKGENLSNILGPAPDHNTTQFKKIQLANHGQWVKFTLSYTYMFSYLYIYFVMSN